MVRTIQDQQPDDDHEELGFFSYESPQPPENQVAPTVLDDLVLARTDDVALLLAAVRAYRSGLMIELEIRLRTSSPTDPLDDRWGDLQRTWLGLELSDGSRIVAGAMGLPSPTQGREPSPYQLAHTGGGGGGRSFRTGFWLTPVPPAGDVELVVLSPLLGAVEARHTLPGDLLAEGAARTVELWPWVPDEPVQPFDLTPPPMPPDGWFARTLG